MKKTSILAAMLVPLILSTAVEAKSRYHKVSHYKSNIETKVNYVQEETALSFAVKEAASKQETIPVRITKKAVRDTAISIVHTSTRITKTGTGLLRGIYSPLANKVREICSVCGSTVISGVRHTRVAGSGRWSLHTSGNAVDIRGNPRCIYSQLQGFPGGYSTDYGRVNHVHISLGGREDGLRFAHGGHGHKHYARHHHTRYASR